MATHTLLPPLISAVSCKVQESQCSVNFDLLGKEYQQSYTSDLPGGRALSRAEKATSSNGVIDFPSSQTSRLHVERRHGLAIPWLAGVAGFDKLVSADLWNFVEHEDSYTAWEAPLSIIIWIEDVSA